jgi:2-oxoglutarate ferredoxin oxidoreductase subunit alpha
LEHRIGGIEKENITGNISYDPANHQLMVKLRQEKVDKIAEYIPLQEIDNGPAEGDLLILGWGSTYGAIKSAVNELTASGHTVAHAHLRYLRPFPKNLADILRKYKKVLVPEINNGQLIRIIRDVYMIDAVGYNKIMGVPITKTELMEEVAQVLRTVEN